MEGKFWGLVVLFNLVLSEYLLFIVMFSCSTLAASPRADVPHHILLMAHDAHDLANFRQPSKLNIAADTNNLLFNALNHYRVDVDIVPISRINLLLKTTDNACATSRIKTTTRARDNVFSLPLNLYIGLRLYFLKSNTDVPSWLTNSHDELTSLKSLFYKSPTAILGINKDRSYGERLDRQIAQLDRRNLFVRGGKSSANSVMHMLKRKRVDYLIDYPDQMKTFIQTEGEKLALSSLGLVGGDRYIVGHVACANTPTGRQFIKEANKALKQLYRTDAFYRAHTRYLDPIDIKQFNRYYQEVFNVTIPKPFSPDYLH